MAKLSKDEKQQLVAEWAEEQMVAAMPKQKLALLVAFLFGMLADKYTGLQLLEEFHQSVIEAELEEELA